MRFTLLLAAFCLLGTGCTAHAHTASSAPHSTSVKVTVGWTWVGGHWKKGHYVKGHWAHPRHGKSYRNFSHGPPPHRSHAQDSWVPGHWEGHGQRRHWVPGHWRR